MIRLVLLDFLATLRERKTWIAAAMLAYAVLAIPMVLEKPPEHVREAISVWFDDTEPFAVFMFVWVDLAMNKTHAFLPVVLGSGVLLRERDTGVLELLAAKPVSMSRYFVVRALSVCAVMLSLFVAAQLFGAAWFSMKVKGFHVKPFLGAMALHALGGVWATALAATIAVAVRRRGISALVSLLVLGSLVGLSLVGYYQPAWRAMTYANPFTLAALSLGRLGSLDAAFLLPPMLALLALTALTIAVGARFARDLGALK